VGKSGTDVKVSIWQGTHMRDYLILLKPRVIWLLILASVAGYVYVSGRSPDPAVLAALIPVGDPLHRRGGRL